MRIAALFWPLVIAAPSSRYSLPNRLQLQEITPHPITNLVNFNDQDSPRPARNVKVSLGVMSHCPDAVLCESVWDKTIDLVGNQMELELLFIGSYVLPRSCQ